MTPFSARVHARMHDRRRARETRPQALPVALLAGVVLLFGVYLLALALAPREEATSKIGVVFGVQVFRSLLDLVVERLAVRGEG